VTNKYTAIVLMIHRIIVLGHIYLYTTEHTIYLTLYTCIHIRD